MHTDLVVKLWIISLTLAFSLIGVSESAYAEDSYKSYLERALAQEVILDKEPEKLKFRHNSTKVIRLWALSKSKSKTKSQRLKAQRGLTQAWVRLAHWSGTSRDREEATRQKSALEQLIRVKKPSIAKKAKNTNRPQTKKVEKAPSVRPKMSKQALQNPKYLLPSLKLEVIEDTAHVLLNVKHKLSVKRHVIPERAARGPRVYFDVSPMVASLGSLKTSMVEHAGVVKLRVGQFDADTVRFVFDIEKGKPTPAVLEFRTNHSPRFVISRRRKPIVNQRVSQRKALEKLVDELQAADKKQASSPAKPKSKMKKKVQTIVREVIKTKGLNSTTVQAIAPRRTSDLMNIRKIVIDPGHGGKDHGASCSKHRREKDINLAIAKKLGKKLRREMGVKIVYTRTKDVFVSLKRRVEIANASGADLFISIHANANENKKVKGVETYYLNTTTDQYALRLARRENTSGPKQLPVRGAVPKVGSSVEDDATMPTGKMGRDMSLLLADLAMKSATEESRRLAGYIQSAIVNGLRSKYKNVRDLGVKRSLFYVLLGVRMPSVLIENGFMSNPMEASRLADSKYQSHLSSAIARGVQRFVLDRRQLAQNSR